MPTRYVLSIDGGGVLGLVPALILAKLEEQTGKPVAALFDLVAGTSTGGVLACCAAAGVPMAKAAKLYQERGLEIFHRPWHRRLLSPFGLTNELYSSGPLEAVLAEYIGDVRLSDADCPILIPAFDLELGQTRFFRCVGPNHPYNHRLRDVARATSAAPTYFEPACISAPGRIAQRKWYIDGGLRHNNPAMCAVVEILEHEPHADIILLSLGTGWQRQSWDGEAARGWGQAQWVKPLVDIWMGAGAGVTHQVAQLPMVRQIRIDFPLPGGCAMDNARPEALATLEQTAEQLIHERGPELAELAEKLSSRK